MDPESIENYNSTEGITTNFEDIFNPRAHFGTAGSNMVLAPVLNFIEESVSNYGLSESTILDLLNKNNFKASDDIFDNISYSDAIAIKSKEFDCPVCYSTEPVSSGVSFDCGHLLCKDCMTNHLKTALSEGKLFETCPVDKCKEIITPALIKKFLPYDTLYETKLLDAIVTAKPNYMWCPNNKCNKIIEFKTLDKTQSIFCSVSCECGYSFCLLCKNKAHRPINCENAEKWFKATSKESKDELSTSWIKTNAKPCPKCKVYIDKNQGCMHMTCSKCKHQFCWICMGDWNTHGEKTGGFYNCNKFQANKNETKEQIDLKRFYFYFDRYESHLNSHTIAREKKEKILKNLNDTIKNLVSNDVRFGEITECIDMIAAARYAFAMTYPIGYYSHLGLKEQDLFETRQSMFFEQLDKLDEQTDFLQDSQKLLDNLADMSLGNYFFGLRYSNFIRDIGIKTNGLRQACQKLLLFIETEFQNQIFNAGDFVPYTYNPISQFSSPSQSQNMFNNQIQNEGGSWKCPVCTLLNDNSLDTCDACGIPREN